MDKQNEGIYDLTRFSAPGRHERFVTVDDEGGEKTFIKGK